MTIFTPQERRVVLFLIVTLLAGSAVRFYRLARRDSRAVALEEIVLSTTVCDSASIPELDTLIAEVEKIVGGEALPLRKRVIDLNIASESDLCLLPGIGPSLARRIVDYRESHGKFESIKDLVRVPGIGEKKLAAIEEMIFTGPGE
jgi:competence ComEA-like helix-hairpin-helix protein